MYTIVDIDYKINLNAKFTFMPKEPNSTPYWPEPWMASQPCQDQKNNITLDICIQNTKSNKLKKNLEDTQHPNYMYNPNLHGNREN